MANAIGNRVSKRRGSIKSSKYLVSASTTGRLCAETFSDRSAACRVLLQLLERNCATPRDASVIATPRRRRKSLRTSLCRVLPYSNNLAVIQYFREKILTEVRASRRHAPKY